MTAKKRPVAKTTQKPGGSKVQEPVANYGSKFWYVIGLGLALAVLAAATFLVYERPPAGWEQAAFTSINNWPEGLRITALAVTALGGTWMAVTTVAATFVLRLYWLSWRLAFSIVAAYGIGYIMKEWVSRLRPEDALAGVHVRAHEAEASLAFPSGHALLIAVVMFTLLPYLPKFWRWVVVLGMIAAVSLTRVYLGLHLPLDVVAGVALGAVVVCLVRVLPQPVRRFLRLG